MTSTIVVRVNAQIAPECTEWIVAHPDNPDIGKLAEALKGRPAPRMLIGGPTPVDWAETGRRMHRERTGLPSGDD